MHCTRSAYMNIHILVQKFSDYSKFIKGYSPRTIQRYKHYLTIMKVERPL
jgi:hypothetical protein